MSIVTVRSMSPESKRLHCALEEGLPGRFVTVEDREELLRVVGEKDTDIVLVPDELCAGGTLVPDLRRADPDSSIVVVLGREGLDGVLERIREGAVDCIPRDNPDHGVEALQQLLNERMLRLESKRLRRHLLVNHLDSPEHFEEIITTDPGMFALFMFVESIAPSTFPVLIRGETGSGKDLLARAVHRAGGRTGPYLVENVAGLDDALFSDALFGHLPGAFTGAESARPGLVEQAEGGTLFLDEIGDLDVRSQIKLLRLLEYNEYYPLGSDEPRRANVRFVVATNRDLDRRIVEGLFREDLYYRLTTHSVELPPLRQRRGDIPLLFRHFVARGAVEMRKPALEISEDLLELLTHYPFPGNVRELHALALHAVKTTVNGLLTREQVRGADPALDTLVDTLPENNLFPPENSTVRFPERLPTMDRVTDLLIDEALRRTDGNQSQAAKLIGVTPSAVSKRLKRRGNS